MDYSVADAHVDVLMRLVEENASFYALELEPTSDSSSSIYGAKLQASYAAMQAGGVKTQVFAVFVDPADAESEQLMAVLRQLDQFERSVVCGGRVALGTSQREIEQVQRRGEIVALLSLEGAGSLHGSPIVLRTLYRLGVRGVGLTWNPANRLADGCMEVRQGGLSNAGIEVVKEIERLPMWLDLAHLGDGSVRDVLQRYSKPVMASHANARAVHDHPRNLTDEVIREIIDRDGWIGLTFQSSFLSPQSPATMDDVGRHIDHLLSLGGSECVGFGSDFDGGITPLVNMPTAAEYRDFSQWIAHRYGADLAQKMLYQNFHRYLSVVLEA